MSAIVSNVHASRTFKAMRTVAISSDTLGIIYQFGGKRPLATRQAMFVEHIWSWAKCRALAPNIYLRDRHLSPGSQEWLAHDNWNPSTCSMEAGDQEFKIIFSCTVTMVTATGDSSFKQMCSEGNPQLAGPGEEG